MTSRPLNWRRLTTLAVVAAVANLVVYVLGDSADATWDAGAPYEIGPAAVVGATLVPLLLGGLVVDLLARRWPRSQHWLAWAGLAFAVLSLPMGYIASQDAPTGVALGAMHLVAGLAWLVGIRPTTADVTGTKEAAHV